MGIDMRYEIRDARFEIIDWELGICNMNMDYSKGGQFLGLLFTEAYESL